MLFAQEGAKVVVSELVKCLIRHSHTHSVLILSLDEKKAQLVVDEIKAAGGDAIAVGGDVGADDFPEKVLKATIEYVIPSGLQRPFL